MAVIGMTARSQDMAAGAVSLGLVTAAGIIVRHLDGSIESQFAFLLALVAISFYEEWRLVLAGFVYVAGFQIFSFLVMYRDAYVQRYGVARSRDATCVHGHGLVLMALLIAGWRLASREKDSRRRRGWFMAAFEKANIAMALLTPSGEFIHANEALVGMLGRVAGSNIRGLVHADDLAELGQAWEDMGNGDHQSATTWMRWRASDGRAIWGRLSSRSFAPPNNGRPGSCFSWKIRPRSSQRTASGARSKQGTSSSPPSPRTSGCRSAPCST